MCMQYKTIRGRVICSARVLVHGPQALTIHNPRAIEYTVDTIQLATCVVCTHYVCALDCTFRGIARTMTKETFHVLLLHLTPNIHFSFCQNIKCTLFTLSKLNWRKIITQAGMQLRRGYMVDSFNCTHFPFHFLRSFTSPYLERHVNVIYIVRRFCSFCCRYCWCRFKLCLWWNFFFSIKMAYICWKKTECTDWNE